MVRIISWLINNYFTKASDKPKVIPFNVGKYRPFSQLIDPDSIPQFLAAVNIAHSNPNIPLEKQSVCHTCGACCASFIVAFPNDEIDIEIGGVVPCAMTLPLDGFRSYMKGTKSKDRRCVALEGSVGHSVNCAIYENRPSTCRNFNRSWEFNKGNELCDKARLAYGLQSFSKY